MPKIALVTGANHGLGLEIACQLAQHAGNTVVIGARDPQKGEEAAGRLRAEGLDVATVTLDVDDAGSAERAARELRDRYGRLDVLVNNAGILPEATVDSVEVISTGMFRRTFDTYYSVIMPAYQASKAALNSVTVGLSKLLADTPIKVNAVCPGFVQTGLTPLNRDQAPLTARDAARVVVRYALIDDGGPSGGFFDRDAAVAW